MSDHYERIFAALDGSKTQREVARKAVQMAAANHAALRFGHVVDSVSADVAITDFDELSNSVKQNIEKDIADILADAKANPDIPTCDLRVEAGPVNDTLDKRLIAPFIPDLVICGERGLSNIKYAFVGSVSTHLIRTLRCDVLVVKQD